MAEEPVVPSVVTSPAPAWRTALATLAVCAELGKARLSALVVLTAGVGFILAARADIDWSRLGFAVLGTAFAALGANALNEWIETERDARMVRTRRRPLPTRRISRGSALAFGLVIGAAGPCLLAAKLNATAAVLALAALLIYVLLYTPLKTRTPLNTLVGAVVGALPPLVGWAAATGRVDAGGWILSGILFLWQIPHFVALAWLYREDYARGGFRMLPTVDPAGHLTGCIAVVYTLVLLLLALMPTLAGVAGLVYALGSLVLGSALLLIGVGLERRRTHAAARHLFLASVVYLPLLLGLMVLDRQPADTATVAPPVTVALPDTADPAAG